MRFDLFYMPVCSACSTTSRTSVVWLSTFWEYYICYGQPLALVVGEREEGNRQHGDGGDQPVAPVDGDLEETESSYLALLDSALELGSHQPGDGVDQHLAF